jgi:hypothetical protein
LSWLPQEFSHSAEQDPRYMVKCMSRVKVNSVASWDELTVSVLKMKRASFQNEKFKQEIVGLWNKTKRRSPERVYLLNLVKRVEDYYFPKFTDDRMRLKSMKQRL